MRQKKSELTKKKKGESEKIFRKVEILNELEENRLKAVDAIIKNLEEVNIRRQELRNALAMRSEEKANKFRETMRHISERKAIVDYKRVRNF